MDMIYLMQEGVYMLEFKEEIISARFTGEVASGSFYIFDTLRGELVGAKEEEVLKHNPKVYKCKWYK